MRRFRVFVISLLITSSAYAQEKPCTVDDPDADVYLCSTRKSESREDDCTKVSDSISVNSDLYFCSLAEHENEIVKKCVLKRELYCNGCCALQAPPSKQIDASCISLCQKAVVGNFWTGCCAQLKQVYNDDAKWRDCTSQWGWWW